MANKFGWFKYRVGTSSGRGEWEYVEIGIDKNSQEAFIEKIEQENVWSEHFRNVDLVRIKFPPKYIIEGRIKVLENRIKSAKDELSRHYAQVRKIPNKNYVFYTLDGWVKSHDDFKEIAKKGNVAWGKKWKRILAKDIYEARKIADTQRKLSKLKA